MEDFATQMNSSASLGVSILISLLGFFLYWGIMISKKKAEKKLQFAWWFWWKYNWFNVALSFLACVIVFVATKESGNLTLDRCALIGLAGSFLVDRLKKTIE